MQLLDRVVISVYPKIQENSAFLVQALKMRFFNNFRIGSEYYTITLTCVVRCEVKIINHGARLEQGRPAHVNQEDAEILGSDREIYIKAKAAPKGSLRINGFYDPVNRANAQRDLPGAFAIIYLA